jgi:hypothetical protein
MAEDTATAAMEELRRVLKKASLALSQRALDQLDASIPDNEHAAISLSIREWVVMATMVDRLVVFATLSKPDVILDPLILRGLEAFRSFSNKLDTINAAAAARRKMEAGK